MYCECGCGQITNIASSNRPNRGVKKGEHYRYIAGHHPHGFPKGHKVNNSRVETEKHKKKISEAMLNSEKAIGHPVGMSSWNKGLSKAKGEMPNCGISFSDETKRKMSKSAKKYWKNNPEHSKQRIKAMLKFSFPNKTELWLESLLEDIFPGEWKFVGDGQIVISGKCPDYINVNGQKKIIELWGDYWHRGENPDDRKDVFKPFGYETLVIWEHELKDMDKLKSTLNSFCR